MTLRIERLDLPDDLVLAADERWPDATWTEVVAYALALALHEAARVDDATGLTADVDVVGAP